MTNPPPPSIAWDPAVDIERALQLALRPKEAAKALGISERKLWSMTNCGEIPHVRAGRAVLYPLHELRAWLAARVKGGEQQ